MIAVVDYQKGNLKSVERGLIAAGGEAFITADASEIAKADAIVLPGVGAFADAAATMCELGQMEAIRDRVRAGVPFLGICLGEHLMFEHGVEGAPEGNPACGLGLLPGTVVAMPRCDAQGKAFKVPHVGWNTIEIPACGGSAAVPPCGEGGGNAVLSSGGAGGGAARSSAAKRGLFERLNVAAAFAQPGMGYRPSSAMPKHSVKNTWQSRSYLSHTSSSASSMRRASGRDSQTARALMIMRMFLWSRRNSWAYSVS